PATGRRHVDALQGAALRSSALATTSSISPKVVSRAADPRSTPPVWWRFTARSTAWTRIYGGSGGAVTTITDTSGPFARFLSDFTTSPSDRRCRKRGVLRA